MFSKYVCFSNVSGFEKVSFWKISKWLLYLSSRVLEKFVLKTLESVSVKSCFCLFEKRESTHESSTYSKELGCVRVLKIVLSHHWEIGSTVVGGIRVTSIVRDSVVTEAIVGHLRSNPNVPDPLYPRQPFRGNWIFWTEGRPLRHPILDDHVRGNQWGVP